MKLFIGLMSGTSMDGIDAALVDVSTNTLIAGLTRAYDEIVKRDLEGLLVHQQTSPAALSQLNTLLGREFALAVHELLAKTNFSTKDVVAIGSHGQTICHDATAKIPYTVQLGCAHTIAELTHIPVVADFRTRDVVMGGQGAPYAPIYHQALFATKPLPLALVNIGGISNISYVLSDTEVFGYDVGPGNCLMDAWIQKNLGLPFDEDGAWAATGHSISPLLSCLLNDPFISARAPKSIGKEYFSLTWLERYLKPDYKPNDVQATLLAFTSTVIAEEIKKRGITLKMVAICGGGAHNVKLQQVLSKQLPALRMDTTEALGVDPDFIEAMMFAWLAEKAMSQTPLDLSSITGAKNMAIYGAIYAAGIDNRNLIDV